MDGEQKQRGEAPGAQVILCTLEAVITYFIPSQSSTADAAQYSRSISVGF